MCWLCCGPDMCDIHSTVISSQSAMMWLHRFYSNQAEVSSCCRVSCLGLLLGHWSHRVTLHHIMMMEAMEASQIFCSRWGTPAFCSNYLKYIYSTCTGSTGSSNFWACWSALTRFIESDLSLSAVLVCHDDKASHAGHICWWLFHWRDIHSEDKLSRYGLTRGGDLHNWIQIAQTWLVPLVS